MYNFNYNFNLGLSIFSDNEVDEEEDNDVLVYKTPTKIVEQNTNIDSRQNLMSLFQQIKNTT